MVQVGVGDKHCLYGVFLHKKLCIFIEHFKIIFFIIDKENSGLLVVPKLGKSKNMNSLLGRDKGLSGKYMNQSQKSYHI